MHCVIYFSNGIYFDPIDISSSYKTIRILGKADVTKNEKMNSQPGQGIRKMNEGDTSLDLKCVLCQFRSLELLG